VSEEKCDRREEKKEVQQSVIALQSVGG
jgi:hypothetical protein